MSVPRRIDTWEISDSDNDSDAAPEPDSKPNSTEPSTNNQDLPEEGAGTGSGSGSVQVRDPSPPKDKEGGGGRKRRSKEEVEEDRRRAKEKKEERERERRARAQEKEERREEQLRRREAAEQLRSLKPENLIKRFTVRVDTALLQHPGSDMLLDTVDTLGWRLSIETQQIPRSVTWTRDQEPCPAEEDQVVLVLPLVPDFVNVVMAVKKMMDGDGDGEDLEAEPVLRTLLENLNRGEGKTVTALVTGCRSRYGIHVLEETLQAQLGMDDLDLQEVLVYLQLSKNISIVFLGDWDEVTQHVCGVTKALSKRPYKVLTEGAELPFCMEGRWASGVRVEKDGSGLGQVWTRQVQQLNRVSQVVASTVTSSFPSPQLLLRAYRGLESQEEEEVKDKKKKRKKKKELLLADLTVRSEGKDRRVGPDISSRIYLCLTAQNPHLVLD